MEEPAHNTLIIVNSDPIPHPPGNPLLMGRWLVLWDPAQSEAVLPMPSGLGSNLHIIKDISDPEVKPTQSNKDLNDQLNKGIITII